MSRSTLILRLGNTLGTTVGDTSRSTQILRSGAGRHESERSTPRLGRTVMFDRPNDLGGSVGLGGAGPGCLLTRGAPCCAAWGDPISFRAGRGLHGSQKRGARMPSGRGGPPLQDIQGGTLPIWIGLQGGTLPMCIGRGARSPLSKLSTGRQRGAPRGPSLLVSAQVIYFLYRAVRTGGPVVEGHSAGGCPKPRAPGEDQWHV